MEEVLNAMAPPRAGAEQEAGDFSAIVSAHQRRIYRVLLGMLRDPDAAETLTQECFVRAFEARGSFRGECSVGTWLLRIAVNLARDHGRNRRLRFWRRVAQSDADLDAVAGALADGRASPERQLLAREQVKSVFQAVGSLSGQQRAVFVLRFVEEMSLEEIAAALGLRTGTVKMHLFRAVQAVRKKVGGA